MQLTKRTYVVISQSTGDYECEPAGTLGVFSTEAEACDCVKDEAQKFYDFCYNNDVDKEQHPLEHDENWSSAEFNYYGVTHSYGVEPNDVTMDVFVLTKGSCEDGVLQALAVQMFTNKDDAYAEMVKQVNEEKSNATEGMDDVSKFFTEDTIEPMQASVGYENHHYKWFIQ